MNNSPIIWKFSFLCCLLPYYGEFKEWHLLINLCWRDSRSVWRLHHKAFIQLHNLTKWRTHKGEIEDCITRRFNINLNLTSKTNLLLFLDDLSDISFINDVKCLRFPLINRLEICKFERMSIIYYKKMDQFLKKSFSSKIYEFVIGCEISTELDALKQGIKGVLRNTTRVVRLERIKLSKEMLKTVINNLTSAQVLKMVSWSIDGVEDFLIEDESLKVIKLKNFMVFVWSILIVYL